MVCVLDPQGKGIRGNVMTKDERAIEAVSNVVCRVLKKVLAHAISQHYSEDQWDEMVEAARVELQHDLDRDPAFNQILSESDVVDRKGVVNARGVITALESMATLTTKAGVSPQLLHVAANMKHVFTRLGFLKEPKETDGQET